MFFNESEVKGLDYNFVDLLDRARKISNVSYLITSGRRSKEENAKVGGVSDSSHLLGVAVDLKCDESKDRFKIIKGLIAVGFVRIGIYENHIHVDNALSLPQGVIWISGKE